MRKEIHAKWIADVKLKKILFFVYSGFFKNVTWFSILYLNFIQVKQFRKKFYFSEFLLDGTGFMMLIDGDLRGS